VKRDQEQADDHFRLPCAKAADARPARLPTGLLGMLALVASVETAVTWAGPRFLDPVSYSWDYSEKAARDKAPGCDVLCLGDSLAKHGLVPRVIEDGTGRRAYNLAVAAGPAPVTFHLFRRALDAGARPTAVVFDLKPGMLAGGPRYAVRYWPRVLNLFELLNLGRSARGDSFLGELLVGAAVPTFRSRHEIRGDLLAALRGETGPLRALNRLCQRNWTLNDGANLATPRAGYTGEVSEAEHAEHLSDRFTAHRVNAEYARRIVALADERGIRAYLVIPPLVPQVHERRRRSGTDAKYDAFLRSLQDRYPALTVLDARDAGFPASVFVDPIHLDIRGALALSAGVADVLHRDLDAARSALPADSKRWVRLATFRERPRPEALEDVELSRARIEASIRR
jgi:hypothetical protein